LGQQIDNLSFSFISPLGSNNDNTAHPKLALPQALALEFNLTDRDNIG
jgi:hypothetical protein